MDTVGFGLAQLECTPLDVEANVALTTAAIESAVAGGADVVVLPELAASGYLLDGAALRPVAESVAAPGPVLSAWSRAAAAHGVTVVGGFAEVTDGELYNSAAVIGPDGAIAGLYRKLHLFGAERGVFTPGDTGLPIIELDGLRLGVLICYDLRFPEALRILALRGANVVAVPTAWVRGFDAEPAQGSESRVGQVDGALVQANLNGVFVGCADQVGSSGPHTFLGRSVLADPFGRPLVGPLDARTPDVTVAQLDLGAVVAARNRGSGVRPIRDRRTDVYDELLGYREPVHLIASA
ncbi:MAG: carbon-nitrogen hydrolase family protein [Jatrophihabitantaceae bacterium]